jgi:predicted short-subunit dehydrogenase-like oxidoreductase (DUF2520 family)
MKSLNIVIIGKGKVGQSLAQLFTTQGFNVTLVGRSFIEQQQACGQADISLITVNDSNIKRVCDALANSFKVGSVVAHCSGALSSSILHSAKKNSCHIASAHPLNTFPSIKASLTTFSNNQHGSYLYAEGEQIALEQLLTLFTQTGFKTQTIERQAKPLYHVACVFACNYLNSLMDMSLNTAEAAGLERTEFWSSLQPLIQATLNNISQQGTAKALSGPIARGDLDTVSTHLQELEDVSKQLKDSYADLGLRALELAIDNGELSDEKISKIEKLLKRR